MTRPLRVLVTVSIGVLLAVALSGCGSTTSSTVELTARDGGSLQTIAVGQSIRISLDSNPSTGYRWEIDGAVPPILEESGAAQYVGGATSAPGAGGTEVWTFVGKSAGAGTLKLKYWRSFEPTATPAKTFEVSVDVR
jgi:inhibitor of cysteine peptidase